MNELSNKLLFIGCRRKAREEEEARLQRKRERENKRNIEMVREYLKTIVEKRKVEQKSPDFVDRGDLLSILVNDDLFKNDSNIIIDECLTFFFAGS